VHWTKVSTNEDEDRMATETGELRTLTVKQLAEATGIQKWRIHQLVAEGHGPPHFRVGSVIRFRVTDVLKWMQQQTATKEKGA
jgi:excisionase family DNA binding protein